MKLRFLTFSLILFGLIFAVDSELHAQRKEDPKMTRARQYMVETAVRQAGVTDERVIKSMLMTQRH
jgi:hypothetical protein